MMTVQDLIEDLNHYVATSPEAFPEYEEVYVETGTKTVKVAGSNQKMGSAESIFLLTLEGV